jgi:hypothetical protein
MMHFFYLNKLVKMKLVNDTNCVFIVGQILFSEETYIHGMLVNQKNEIH